MPASGAAVAAATTPWAGAATAPGVDALLRQRQRVAAAGRRPPRSSTVAGSATPCAASQCDGLVVSGRAASRHAWQRLRIVGSSVLGRGASRARSARRRPAPPASSAARWRRCGSCARPDRPARDLAAAARRGASARTRSASRTASTRISLLGLRVLLVDRRRRLLAQRPAQRLGMRLGHQHAAGRDASAACDQAAARTCAAGADAACRRPRTARPAPAPAPSSNWPTPGGPCSSRRGRAAPAVRRSGRREPGQGGAAVRRRRAIGARARQRGLDLRQTCVARLAGVDAREALRRSPPRARHSRRARARRSRRSCASKRSAARAAARRSRGDLGRQVEPERQVGLQRRCLHPASSCASTRQVEAAAARPGRRRSRR